MFIGVHHVGYLVDNLDETIQAYQELYGSEVELRFRNEGIKCNVAFLKSGATRVELMEPDDKAQLGGSKAQVLHHVGYQVPDIEKAMAEMRAKGIKFLDETPRVGPTGWKIAYFDGGDRLGVKQHISQG